MDREVTSVLLYSMGKQPILIGIIDDLGLEPVRLLDRIAVELGWKKEDGEYTTSNGNRIDLGTVVVFDSGDDRLLDALRLREI